MAGRPVVALVGAFAGGEGTAAAYLERRGHEVRLARSDWEAEALLSHPDIDVAVVDLDSPAGSGISLLRQFGRQGGPFFLIVSKQPDVVEKVLALELGAADVVEKSISEASSRHVYRGSLPGAARAAANSSSWKTQP